MMVALSCKVTGERGRQGAKRRSSAKRKGGIECECECECVYELELERKCECECECERKGEGKRNFNELLKFIYQKSQINYSNDRST